MWNIKKIEELQKQIEHNGDHFSELISLILDHLNLDIEYLPPSLITKTMKLVPKKKKYHGGKGEKR